MNKLTTKDLMIGDWVMVAECVADAHFIDYPDKIESIRDGLVGLESDGLETIIERIAPIPLTSEILEENGFVKQAYDGWLISENNGRRLIEYRIDYFDGMLRIDYAEEPFSKLTIKVKYLHELQHAMRLAGINKEIEL